MWGFFVWFGIFGWLILVVILGVLGFFAHDA